MKIFSRYIFFVILPLLSLTYLLFTFEYLNIDRLLSVMWAALLNVINISAALLLFGKSYDASNKKFLISNLGGLGMRLVFLLALILITLKFLNIDEYGFILAFFIFYFFAISFEIAFFISKTKNIAK